MNFFFTESVRSFYLHKMMLYHSIERKVDKLESENQKDYIRDCRKKNMWNL